MPRVSTAAASCLRCSCSCDTMSRATRNIETSPKSVRTGAVHSWLESPRKSPTSSRRRRTKAWTWSAADTSALASKSPYLRSSSPRWTPSGRVSTFHIRDATIRSLARTCLRISRGDHSSGIGRRANLASPKSRRAAPNSAGLFARAVASAALAPELRLLAHTLILPDISSTLIASTYGRRPLPLPHTSWSGLAE